jgi:hypothetical protein
MFHTHSLTLPLTHLDHSLHDGIARRHAALIQPTLVAERLLVLVLLTTSCCSYWRACRTATAAASRPVLPAGRAARLVGRNGVCSRCICCTCCCCCVAAAALAAAPAAAACCVLVWDEWAWWCSGVAPETPRAQSACCLSGQPHPSLNSKFTYTTSSHGAERLTALTARAHALAHTHPPVHAAAACSSSSISDRVASCGGGCPQHSRHVSPLTLLLLSGCRIARTRASQPAVAPAGRRHRRLLLPRRLRPAASCWGAAYRLICPWCVFDVLGAAGWWLSRRQESSCCC